MEEFHYDTEEFRDSIATIDKTGKRKWIYPKKPSGRFFNYRKVVSYVLLLVLFGLPWVKYNGEPLVLFNVLQGKFIILGTIFTPQDFHIFGLAMIIGILFIALFTVVFGRIFCGWICPQTIFMEMVFRRIEYAIEGDANQQRKLNAAPWNGEKIWKKTLKTSLFFVLSVLVANTFLAYLIGMDEVLKIVSEPVSMHMGGFVSMVMFSFAFFGVFSVMREQVCVTICPYGRMQGVMLGKESIVISYDWVRGEPRGKIKKQQPGLLEQINQTATQGDCIDCKLCIHVCPTGIDIRNGTQLECVNCTACIDVCDDVMEKVEKPKGLIRYDSFNGITTGKKFTFTPRIIGYIAVLGILLSLEGYLIFGRNKVETLILRTPGTLYNKVDDTHLSNLYNYEVINKSSDELKVVLKMKEAGEIKMIGKDTIIVSPSSVSKGAMMVILEKQKLKSQKTTLHFDVVSEGKIIDNVSTNFLGPIK